MELLSINSTLGERIRFYRQQAGLTQKELAALCEVSESAIRCKSLDSTFLNGYNDNYSSEVNSMNFRK